MTKSFSLSSKLKGAQMLDPGLAYGDETLTIRFAHLQNLENFGRKYPAAHLYETTAFWRFSESRWKMAVFGPQGVKQYRIFITRYMTSMMNFHMAEKKSRKNHRKFLFWFFTRKKLPIFFKFFSENRRYDPCYHALWRFDLYIPNLHVFLRRNRLSIEGSRGLCWHRKFDKSAHTG